MMEVTPNCAGALWSKAVLYHARFMRCTNVIAHKVQAIICFEIHVLQLIFCLAASLHWDVLVSAGWGRARLAQWSVLPWLLINLAALRPCSILT